MTVQELLNFLTFLLQELQNSLVLNTTNSRNTCFDDDNSRVTDRKNLVEFRRIERPTKSVVKTIRKLLDIRFHKHKKRDLQNRTLLKIETLRCENSSCKIYKILNSEHLALRLYLES